MVTGDSVRVVTALSRLNDSKHIVTRCFPTDVHAVQVDVGSGWIVHAVSCNALLIRRRPALLLIADFEVVHTAGLYMMVSM